MKKPQPTKHATQEFCEQVILEAIRQFIIEVERRAEKKMLQTGKLEGAHYAAMKEYFKELESK